MASRMSQPDPAGHAPTRITAVRTIGMLGLVVALVLAGLWWHARHRTESAAPAAQSSPALPPASRTTSAAPASTGATPSGCTTATAPLVPTVLDIDRLHLHVPVLQVDAASSHGTMAPPTDQPWEAAWIDTTARPGSLMGAVNLSAHTYQQGGALGNLLYHDDPLRPGDLLRLSDAAGHRVCYRYTGLTKFRAADYTSDSTLYYDASARPELRLMVCWDKDAAGTWESRVVFRATPVA